MHRQQTHQSFLVLLQAGATEKAAPEARKVRSSVSSIVVFAMVDELFLLACASLCEVEVEVEHLTRGKISCEVQRNTNLKYLFTKDPRVIAVK